MFVLRVIRTVNAAVDTVIGQIQRREQYDPVAVKVFFDLLGQLIDLLVLIFQIAVQEHRRFPVAQPLSQPGFVKDLIDQLPVMFIGLRVGQRFHDLLMVDKIVRVF